MRLTTLLGLGLLLGTAASGVHGQSASVRLPGLNGPPMSPFSPPGRVGLTFFVQTDCPVSNSYAPEIQRVCRDYGSKGVSCSLIYEDVDVSASTAPLDAQVRRHLEEYGYRNMPAAIDRDRSAATFARATITPQAIVTDRTGAIRYRGRIDNLYAAFGKTRQQVTSHDLRDALDAVVAGRAVATPETEALGCFIVDPALLRKHDHE